MRRLALICIAMALASLVASPIADARKKPKRTVRTESAGYEAPSIGIAGGPEGGICGSPPVGCTEFQAKQSERYLSVAVIDHVGAQVAGVITVNDVRTKTFCGKTLEPLEIAPGAKIRVGVFSGPTMNEVCAGIATRGIVIAEFSNLP